MTPNARIAGPVVRSTGNVNKYDLMLRVTGHVINIKQLNCVKKKIQVLKIDPMQILLTSWIFSNLSVENKHTKNHTFANPIVLQISRIENLKKK